LAKQLCQWERAVKSLSIDEQQGLLWRLVEGKARGGMAPQQQVLFAHGRLPFIRIHRLRSFGIFKIFTFSHVFTEPLREVFFSEMCKQNLSQVLQHGGIDLAGIALRFKLWIAEALIFS